MKLYVTKWVTFGSTPNYPTLPIKGDNVRDTRTIKIVEVLSTNDVTCIISSEDPAGEIVKVSDVRLARLALCLWDDETQNKVMEMGVGIRDFPTNDLTIIGYCSKDALSYTREGEVLDETQIRKHGKLKLYNPIIPGMEVRTLWGDRVLVGEENHRGFNCTYLDDAELNHSRDCRKGGTYDYGAGTLGFVQDYVYNIKGPCNHFH